MICWKVPSFVLGFKPGNFRTQSRHVEHKSISSLSVFPSSRQVTHIMYTYNRRELAIATAVYDLLPNYFHNVLKMTFLRIICNRTHKLPLSLLCNSPRKQHFSRCSYTTHALAGLSSTCTYRSSIWKIFYNTRDIEILEARDLIKY